MARRGVLASLARAWCLPLAFSRDRRLLALLRQAILFALVFWVARSWATEKPASVRHAPRSFPEDLTRLAAPVLTVRTLEQDAREHGARWPPRRSPQRRVLFMTYEIAGPHMNGGIGTAFRNLAASLAARGHNVSVVVVTGPRSNPNSGRTWEQWVEYFKSEHGISLTAFEEHPKAWDVIRHSFDLKKARQAYNWLLPRQNDFDIVHFHEWRGLSYFIMGSKRLGLAFQNTLLVTGTHGPDLWAHMASLKVAPNKTIEPAFLERKAVELADLVVSPSRYMLEWMNQQRWPLAPRLAVSENVLSPSFLSTAIRRNDVVKAKEFAFFGRLEARKGFAIFKEAMLELQKKHPAVRVTLIGKSESEALIAGLPSEWSLHTNFSIEVAHEYLRQPGRVAVVPSLIDNSPYTILECLAIGIPLIASDAGGNGELFAPEFRKTNMFRPSKGELLRIAKVAVERGIPIARPSTEPGQLQEAWGLWHDAVPVTPAISKKGKVAVVAATVEGVTPEHAVRWLEEALGQWKGETILVHRNKWTFAKPSGWKLVRVDDSLAKMWTKGASLVRADAVLFVDLVSRPKLDIALLEGAFGIADNRVVVIPSYAQGNDSWAFDATAPQAGGASTLAMDDGVRKGRSIAVRKAVLEQTGGFDLGRYPCEAVTNFLINLDVARIPVLVLPDPVPASSGQNPSLKDVEGEKMIVYNALVRYFPQDTGMALVVADRMAGREARTVAESRKDFSLHQVGLCLLSSYPGGSFDQQSTGREKLVLWLSHP